MSVPMTHENRFSRGEGAAVIVIKPLDDAIQDGDHIYASVRSRNLQAFGMLKSIFAARYWVLE